MTSKRTGRTERCNHAAYYSARLVKVCCLSGGTGRSTQQLLLPGFCVAQAASVATFLSFHYQRHPSYFFFFLLIPSNLMQFQTFIFFFFFSTFFMAAAARVIKSTGYQLFWFHVDSSPSLFRLSIGLLSTTAAMRWWALTSNLVLRPFLLLRLIFFLRISWFSSRDRWKQCRIWLCYSFILLERRKREAILLFSEFVVLSAALFFFSILL